jgi:hypothetical protein
LLSFAPGQAVFFAAFTLAQRARCAAEIFLRAAADKVRFLGIVTKFFLPFFDFNLDQRALWAAAILARPGADILRRVFVGFPYAAPKAVSAAEIPCICFVNRSCSLFNIWTTPPRFVIFEDLGGDCIRTIRAVNE